MARNNFSFTTLSAFALAPATIKTILEFTAGTGIIAAITGATVTFDGTSNSAVPVIVQIVRVSGTAATGTARNPLKTKDTTVALLSTGKENCTVEPGTIGDIMETFHIHPQAGVVYQLPIRDEVEVPSTARLALRITAPAAVNVLAKLSGEE